MRPKKRKDKRSCQFESKFFYRFGKNGGYNMIHIRKSNFFKIISLGLVFIFLFQAEGLISQVENQDSIFEQAKKDYLQKNYERAALHLPRLASRYENMENQSEELKLKYGQTLILLGACHENMHRVTKAEEIYITAKKLLGKNHFIEGANFDHLSVYAKIFDVEKIETKSDSRVIESASQKKKKKKFPWLLAAGAAVVVGTLVYFFVIKKSKKYTLTVNVGEGIDGTPAAGTYKYKKGTVVNYSYTLQSGYRDLVVTLDGNPVPSSGTIKMDGNHSLTVSCTKIGRINSVTVFFRVRFAATNLKVRHRIWVDNNLQIDEILNFRVRPSDKWNDALKIYKNFYVSGGPSTIQFKQEAGPYYSSFYSGNYRIWGTYYELEITDYTYIDGADPGWPTLSEDWFYLDVAPWRTDPSHEWYRIKTKEITINPPATAAFQKRRNTSKDVPKADSPHVKQEDINK
jgi:hypothetical protein